MQQIYCQKVKYLLTRLLLTSSLYVYCMVMTGSAKARREQLGHLHVVYLIPEDASHLMSITTKIDQRRAAPAISAATPPRAPAALRVAAPEGDGEPEAAARETDETLEDREAVDMEPEAEEAEADADAAEEEADAEEPDETDEVMEADAEAEVIEALPVTTAPMLMDEPPREE